jgi:hypothetical protein
VSALPPAGARFTVYARYSTDRLGASSIKVLDRDRVAFDPAQAPIVQRMHADYASGLSLIAIAQALQDADRGGAS